MLVERPPSLAVRSLAGGCQPQQRSRIVSKPALLRLSSATSYSLSGAKGKRMDENTAAAAEAVMAQLRQLQKTLNACHWLLVLIAIFTGGILWRLY